MRLIQLVPFRRHLILLNGLLGCALMGACTTSVDRARNEKAHPKWQGANMAAFEVPLLREQLVLEIRSIERLKESRAHEISPELIRRAEAASEAVYPTRQRQADDVEEARILKRRLEAIRAESIVYHSRPIID